MNKNWYEIIMNTTLCYIIEIIEPITSFSLYLYYNTPVIVKCFLGPIVG